MGNVVNLHNLGVISLKWVNNVSTDYPHLPSLVYIAEGPPVVTTESHFLGDKLFA